MSNIIFAEDFMELVGTVRCAYSNMYIYVILLSMVINACIHIRLTLRINLSDHHYFVSTDWLYTMPVAFAFWIATQLIKLSKFAIDIFIGRVTLNVPIEVVWRWFSLNWVIYRILMNVKHVCNFYIKSDPSASFLARGESLWYLIVVYKHFRRFTATLRLW